MYVVATGGGHKRHTDTIPAPSSVTGARRINNTTRGREGGAYMKTQSRENNLPPSPPAHTHTALPLALPEVNDGK